MVVCSGTTAEPGGPMFHQASLSLRLISPDQQRTGMSLILLIATDKLLAAFFEAIQLRFPSSLFGMLGMFALLLVLDRVNPSAGKRVLAAYKPGVDFIARWLAVCFVPTLVMLPLAPMPGSADLMRVAFAIVTLWISSLVSVGLFAGFLQKMLPEGGEVGEPSAPMIAPPYEKLSRQLGMICAGLFVVSLVTGCLRPVVTLYTLLATVLGFCVGTLPNKTVKMFVHPLITCALVTLGAIGLLGVASGAGFAPLLSNYVSHSADMTMQGGGDLLLSLLGPAVVSFGFQMYGRKQLMRARAPEVSHAAHPDRRPLRSEAARHLSRPGCATGVRDHVLRLGAGTLWHGTRCADPQRQRLRPPVPDPPTAYCGEHRPSQARGALPAPAG